MKHGIKLRKLQRTSSHRYALLRNLVSALLHHEAIKTTIPKAKEAARMAEKMITLGKKGTDPARRSALAFLMPGHYTPPSAAELTKIPPPKPLDYPHLPAWLESSSSASSSSSSSSSSSTAPTSSPVSNSNSNTNPYSIPTDPEEFITPPSLPFKLFQTLSTRYASRPGGYTRIQKFGRRPGDNAPVCILSLVDGPRDLKFEMVARAVGKETLSLGLGSEEGLKRILDSPAETFGRPLDGLRERTKRGMEKVLKFRDEDGKRIFQEKAVRFADTLIAEESALGGHRKPKDSNEKPQIKALAVKGVTVPYQGRRHLAGERMAGMPITNTGLGLARGLLGRRTRGNGDRMEGRRVPKFMSELRQRQSEVVV